MPHPAIFISYRVADSQVHARLLYTSLANYFGPEAVFLDKKRLEPGVDWDAELETNVANAKVLLVLIQDAGKWLGVDVKTGVRRTDDEKDWVRLEIEKAHTGKKAIIPVLIDGAELPPEIALTKTLRFLRKKQTHKIATDEKWDSGVAELCKILEEKQIPQQASDAPRLDALAEFPLPEKGLDPLKTHESPFLGLQYFDRQAARLFFGRTRELLEFFSHIQNPETRLLCLYGPSGVGKSSFLAAGVFPRLEAFRTAYYARRRKTEGLGNQLEQLRQQPTEAGKPPVYILDQAEEMFTDPLPGEPADFVQKLQQVLDADAKVTVVLGFRSDYQLDMRDLLACVDCHSEDLTLRSLDQSALIEAIEGLSKNESLRKRYQLELEAGFAEHVARDIMRSESGGAASVLQNRLLKLYTEAKKQRSAAEPQIRLRIEDYLALKQSATAEEELLDFQLQRLPKDGLPPGTDEKVILETLAEFVVDKPTAGTLLKDQLPDERRALHEALRRVSLLSELPDSQAIRLSHDLLAPVIRKRYNQFLVDETDRLEIENVRLNLREVSKHLLDVQFTAALGNLTRAALRNVLPEEVWPLAFELAFVFLYAGKKKEGTYALLETVNHLQFAQKHTPPFPDENFPDDRSCAELLEFLRHCEPAEFIRMEQRYFPVMVRVEGGTFDMGDVLGDEHEVEKEETVHQATVSSFELAETATTWQQFALFCLATGREVPADTGRGRGERPVMRVSWYDAVEYANWLSNARGLTEVYRIEKNKQDPNNQGDNDKIKWTVTHDNKAGGFRLPTETEWEFAARERGRAVRFGNGENTADPARINFDASEKYKESYSVVGEFRQKAMPVRFFKPNGLGLYEMSGNVWEWCGDWYGEYPSEVQIDPTGPASGYQRVLRGGGWPDVPEICRAATRGHNEPADVSYDVGFRLALQLGG